MPFLCQQVRRSGSSSLRPLTGYGGLLLLSARRFFGRKFIIVSTTSSQGRLELACTPGNAGRLLGVSPCDDIPGPTPRGMKPPSVEGNAGSTGFAAWTASASVARDGFLAPGASGKCSHRPLQSREGRADRVRALPACLQFMCI